MMGFPCLAIYSTKGTCVRAYEVVLNKLQKAAATVKPPLSAQEMEKIYKLADQMDKHIKDHLDEGDLLPDNDLFRKRTLH